MELKDESKMMHFLLIVLQLHSDMQPYIVLLIYIICFPLVK